VGVRFAAARFVPDGGLTHPGAGGPRDAAGRILQSL